MNFLSILLGLEKTWESLPKGERSAIIDTIDRIGVQFLAHRQEAAAAEKPPAQPANK
jgi:hypothetical protein